MMQILPVMEHFYTIQGEGYYSGSAAYFIRLAGCDVGCFWCDVKESWETENHPTYNIQEILDFVKSSSTKTVVVTGGEPLMHDLSELTEALQSNNLRTNIETSGSWPLNGYWDWICVSPKKFKAPLESVLKKANELKIVVFNKSDFAWAELHQQKISKDCKLYLQPEWDKSGEMLPEILNYIKANPQWRISLQTHKYMQIP